MARDYIWRPSPETVANANITAFMTKNGIADYDALIAKADREPEWYWTALLDFLGIRFTQPYDKILDLKNGPAWADWCVGGKTNFVINVLDKHLGTPTEDKIALIGESEDGEVVTWTYRDLARESAKLAGALADLGIAEGDAVAVYMPMVPEVAVAFFAIARLGALVVPLFSGFAADAIVTRLNDAGAKAALTVVDTARRGRRVPMQAVLDQAAASVPTLRHMIVLGAEGAPPNLTQGRDHDWRAITAGRADDVPAAAVDANHPLLLVYTSGTSGRPKGVVLTHLGFTVRLGLDFGLCMDVKADDRLMWMTDFGWVVGPMTIGAALFHGGSIVLVEGVPDYPDSGRMWRLIETHRVSFLGASPTAVRSLMRYGDEDVDGRDLDSIRVTASTGEPWTDEAWYWFFDHVCRRQAPLLNWSGGTEVGGGIIIGTVIHPLKPCGFAGPVPGTGADILDEDGNSVGPDQVGELVMRRPSMGLTRGIWQDPERYIETYWSTYPDIWRHGDWASRDADGVWYVHGRSDDTIKVSGKRTGPAEIEGMVLATGKIAEAAAIGLPDPITGSAVACVCVPADGEESGEALAQTVREAVAQGLGKSFRPKRVIFVPDLPKTRSLKIMRRVVRALVLGEPTGDTSGMVNPEALDLVRRAAAE